MNELGGNAEEENKVATGANTRAVGGAVATGTTAGDESPDANIPKKSKTGGEDIEKKKAHRQNKNNRNHEEEGHWGT